jgi:hypothetical protein
MIDRQPILPGSSGFGKGHAIWLAPFAADVR